jgi:hypothetical protein
MAGNNEMEEANAEGETISTTRPLIVLIYEGRRQKDGEYKGYSIS